MAFFDKLKFWKKKDDFSDLGLKGNDLGMGGHDLGLGAEPSFGHDAGFGSSDLGLGPEPRGFEQRPMQPFQQTPQYNYPQPTPMMPQQPQFERSSRDSMEILSSKLDVLKAKLDSIDQRLSNIERMAEGEVEDRRRRTW